MKKYVCREKESSLGATGQGGLKPFGAGSIASLREKLCSRFISRLFYIQWEAKAEQNIQRHKASVDILYDLFEKLEPQQIKTAMNNHLKRMSVLSNFIYLSFSFPWKNWCKSVANSIRNPKSAISNRYSFSPKTCALKI